MAASEETSLSVFEFIYVDWKRVANLLAQLDPNGVLTALETTTTREKSAGVDLKGSGEAGFPMINKSSVGGKLSGEMGVGSSVSRQFDAKDIAPQTLLSLLDARGLISRTPKDSQLGSIALFSGKLNLMDLGVMGDGWKSINGGMNDGSGDIASKVFSDPIAFLFGGRIKTWIPLKREGWELGLSSILTHSHCIDGKWSFLGIIAKLPQDKPPPVPQAMFSDGHLIPNILGSMEDVRQHMGCPSDFYAMTPLLGFREISSDK